ncbi:putative YigZ family protein [Dysgonomonas sp. PH5-45]|uniref:IMPACT family protein n=1 Tax=unclassified Dysgonomonas TaxID=2630389 RepID=UPI0024769626|nr:MULTISPECIES: YigZ family protein [unclassified Dysgonomonas]MDH6355322.1 putative YigZ family protein [Dysgonomonas sp. PH5-45]MDH6388220.1 putative YigZ family protein [Dysgonomonas sp. PH5-37]
MDDTYKTIKETSKAIFTEQKSKFISYAIPINRVDEVKPILEKYRKEYYDSRHVCWAYMLGADRKEFRANDDGEPSGTAGKPILGQINSNELTNILVLVVRYFGGIKLGTSGLITAYKAAAAEAIGQAEIVERTVDCDISFRFEYPFMNDVMKIVKDMDATILKQEYNTDCTMDLRIRKADFETLQNRLKKVESLSFPD